MKPFAVKSPAKGKTTVSVVAQVYDKIERRTKTAYVASFSQLADPATLPACIRLGKGATSAGFTLEIATVLVREWLEKHGTFGRATAPKMGRPALAPSANKPKPIPESVREQVMQELAASRRTALWLRRELLNPALSLHGIRVDFAMSGTGDWFDLYHMDGSPVVGQGTFAFGPMRLFCDATVDDIIKWFIETHGEAA